MGKIKTEGRVTLEFEPDLYEISVTVRAEGETSGAAVTAGKKQTEMLLQYLRIQLDILPEQLTAESENVSVPYRDEKYIFSRELLLKIPADNHVREALTEMLSEMQAVSYDIRPKLADESRQKQAALDAAVQNAREKAERLAAAMHSRVTSFDEICTDGMGMQDGVRSAAACAAPRMKNLAADLQNPKIKITGEVTVVWLTES
ncbi:MAG: SIMPL domain-containing protein [Oscillospiraceae bacterium]|jgi:uncharacterized protein YggE|nr:SIMPL domain-containing protein [Oscillospiraceae bacterium]